MPQRKIMMQEWADYLYWLKESRFVPDLGRRCRGRWIGDRQARLDFTFRAVGSTMDLRVCARFESLKRLGSATGCACCHKSPWNECVALSEEFQTRITSPASSLAVTARRSNSANMSSTASRAHGGFRSDLADMIRRTALIAGSPRKP